MFGLNSTAIQLSQTELVYFTSYNVKNTHLSKILLDISSNLNIKLQNLNLWFNMNKIVQSIINRYSVQSTCFN